MQGLNAALALSKCEIRTRRAEHSVLGVFRQIIKQQFKAESFSETHLKLRAAGWNVVSLRMKSVSVDNK